MNLLEHFLLFIENATAQTDIGDACFDFVYASYTRDDYWQTHGYHRLRRAIVHYESLPCSMHEAYTTELPKI